jgi:hypothetical protein
MPLHWKIAPLEQMVVCVSEGAVTKDELMAYFKALDEAGASRYRKMLDANRAECRLTAEEIAEMAAYAKSHKGQGTPAPMAIFTGSSGNDEFIKAVTRRRIAGDACIAVTAGTKALPFVMRKKLTKCRHQAAGSTNTSSQGTEFWRHMVHKNSSTNVNQSYFR